MTDLQRKAQKIFGNNAPTDEVTVFGTALNSESGKSPDYSKDVETLQSLPAYSTGWSAAVLDDFAPFMEDSNALHYISTYQIAYLMQKGLPEWDSNTPYYALKSFCQVDGVWYQSLVDNNVNNNPATDDGTNWKKIDLENRGTGRNTGDIFFTTRTDNPLNGAYRCTGQEFQQTDFAGNDSPYNLLIEGKLPSVTYEEYQTQIETNGVCGVFALDTVNGKFKIPTLNDVYVCCADDDNLGAYIKSSAPRLFGGTTGIVWMGQTPLTSGILGIRNAQSGSPSNSGSNINAELTLDSQQIDSVYTGENGQKKITVNSICYHAMVQLANSAEAITSIAQYTNQIEAATQGAISEIQSYGNVPRYLDFENAISVAEAQSYTTPTYGWLSISNNTGTLTSVSINGKLIIPERPYVTYEGYLEPNTTVTTSHGTSMVFIPMKGNN